MKRLGIEDFTTPIDDVEKRQYAILGALQQRHEEICHTRLFPSFSDLLELSLALRELVDNKNELDAKFPRKLKDVDWDNKELIFELSTNDTPDIERMFELAAWALPYVHGAMEEAKTLYDFVDENLDVEGVGIMPMYTSEGYFFVPEHRAHILHILRYELSMLHGNGQHFQAMKTRELHAMLESTTRVDPQNVKLSLLSEHKELPNPATFVIETELDFPYIETMLPVAKRKLLNQLMS